MEKRFLGGKGSREVVGQDVDLDGLPGLDGECEGARRRPHFPRRIGRGEEAGSVVLAAPAARVQPYDVITDGVSLALSSPEGAHFFAPSQQEKRIKT